jgi:tetratricopeptide (TPR) repeat protein
VDPDKRRELVDACVVDYESALLFLDVALDATARGLGAASGLASSAWPRLVVLAENGHSLPPRLAEDVLYLQRTVLWARNKAIVHPQDHMLEVSWDTVGNLSFWRISPSLNGSDATRLDELLHRIRPDLPTTAQVGNGVPAYMALTWIGARAGTLSTADRKLFEELRTALGFQLPPPPAIAAAIERFLEGVVALIPTDQRGHIALASVSKPADPPPPQIHPPDDPLAGEVEISAAYDLRETQTPAAALAALESLVVRFPDSALLHIAMADVCVDLERYDDAIAHSRIAGAIGWPGPRLQQKLASCHFNLAVAAYNNQDMATAAKHYREVTRLRPHDTEAGAHLAVALARLGDRQGALIEAERILNGIDTVGQLASLDLGVVLMEAELWEFALAQFDAYLTQEPTSIMAMANRAGCLAMLGRGDEARGVLERVIDIEPADISALRNLAGLLRKQGEDQRAIEVVRHILAVNPEDDWARAQLEHLG